MRTAQRSIVGHHGAKFLGPNSPHIYFSIFSHLPVPNLEKAQPLRSLLAAGIPLAFGSDAPTSLEKAMQWRLTLQKRGPHETIVTIDDKVNSHSILSNLCFPRVSVPSGD
jgi:hypothetical protein